MGELILILGGVRSGKSAYAQRLAETLGGESVLFVATAEALDDEMHARIAAHRRDRPAPWHTLEAPRGVAEALEGAHDGERVVVLDCVTVWVSNLLLACGEEPDARAAEDAVQGEVARYLAAVERSSATHIAVSNEVGLGVVPPYPLGRLYRDLLGRANQMLAARAARVLLLVAGLPLDVKALQALSALPDLGAG